MFRIRTRTLLTGLLLLAVAPLAICGPNTLPPRTLRVALFPYVPDKVGFFAQVKNSFEHNHPDILLDIVDLSANYYDESSPGAITNTDADILEVDSVFLEDLVAAGRIQALASSVVPSAALFAPVARGAMNVDGRTYSIPHWLCTNYLFIARQDTLAKARSFDEIVNAIPESHADDHGLLIDLEGKGTLGELYLDALLDRDRTLEKASAHLTLSTYDNEVGRVLTDVRKMCDKTYCRSTQLSNDEDSYPRLFAHRHGRALIGYSERLYYIERENRTACKKDECLAGNTITAIAPPLARSGARSFAWVDGFTVANSCTGQCLADAEVFIREVASADAVKSTLLPADGQVPRYLMPAMASLYTDPALLRAAPLYKDLYPVVKEALAIRGLHLNSNLRDIGKKLDNDVLAD
ncbi:MAG TPA: extracellular solute-binding protein [Steroidobacteraceae bacterium]|nr:extracellular solute-binding protein [Steroidobacteraceae bacterium]